MASKRSPCPKGRPGRPGSRSQVNAASQNGVSSPNKLQVPDSDQSDDEGWICSLCDNVFIEPTAKVLECQRCAKHFCIKCLNKSESEYEMLDNSDVMWFCGHCREKVERNIAADLKIEERCSKFMQQFEERIMNIELEIAKKCDDRSVRVIVKEECQKMIQEKVSEERVKQMIDLTMKDVKIPKFTMDENCLKEVRGEINREDERKKAIIIHRVNESTSDEPEVRKQHDTNFVNGLMDILKVRKIETRSIIRLGARERGDETKPRPIKVLFTEEAHKTEVFKNIHRLGGVEDESEYANISIANDMSKEDRAAKKLLVEEAKAKQNNDKSGNWVYRVRGPPWRMRIVKEKKSVIKETYRKNKPQALVCVKCSPYHVADKAVLMGDAAHAMVPFYGQGMNTGFEDCLIFDQILENFNDDFSQALPEFTNARNEDAKAICDLAMYNYIEMRAKVNSRFFTMRKKLDNFLYWLMPHRWIPLYTMVSFTRTRFTECINRRKQQDKILKVSAIGLSLATILAGIRMALPALSQLYMAAEPTLREIVTKVQEGYNGVMSSSSN